MKLFLFVMTWVYETRFYYSKSSLKDSISIPPENKTQKPKNHNNAKTQKLHQNNLEIIAMQPRKHQHRKKSWAVQKPRNCIIATQPRKHQHRKKSWFLGLNFCFDWDRDLGLGFWEMDLDEEGRRDLGEMDFWGLGRREENGEQDLKWRKKGRRWWIGPEMEKKERRKKMHTKIESLKLDLLQWNRVS